MALTVLGLGMLILLARRRPGSSVRPVTRGPIE
jgi:hypothetical protein